jgi:GTP-binding protein HflX
LALLVGVVNRQVSFDRAAEFLNELSALADTAGLDVAELMTVSSDRMNVATFVGSGKVQQIKEKIESKGLTLIVFDDELSPTQLRNLEEALKVKIMDRTGLILEIFAAHARTAIAKAQVELAQLQYRLPRLTRMWTHLSRERGGIGLKGAGEQEIETDRRVIRTRIAQLKRELEDVKRQAETRRKQRGSVVKVALVGYTNVGKSTLMNAMTKAGVVAENKLFATLDATVRRVCLFNVPFLLSDTVGFIRKLPHSLVESFHSTLQEVREADLLLHVVDVSNLQHVEHIKTVRQTLSEIGASETPTIYVFNKCDRLSERDLDDLERAWNLRDNYPAVFVSAELRQNFDELRRILTQKVVEIYAQKYPEVLIDPQFPTIYESV